MEGQCGSWMVNEVESNLLHVTLCTLADVKHQAQSPHQTIKVSPPLPPPPPPSSHHRTVEEIEN